MSLEHCHRYIIRKLDVRIMLFACILEFFSYLNRACMGYVTNLGLNQDISLSPTEGDWSVALMYLGYFIFTVPSALLILYTGTTIYLTIILLVWGSLSIGMGFAKNIPLLLVLRFLLGMAISGFFPGMLAYLSRCYPKTFLTMRIVVFYIAAISSAAVAAILVFVIEKMDGIGGLESWQWLFILIGIPVVLLGITTFLFLDKISNPLRFLQPAEREILINNLCDEMEPDANEPEEKHHVQWCDICSVLSSGKIWLFAAICAGNSAVTKYWIAYFPSLVKYIGYTGASGLLMNSPPYALACVFALVGGLSVARFNGHGYHMVVFEIISVIGFALMAAFEGSSTVVVYVSGCFACSGAYATFALLMAWLTINVSGRIRRTLVISFVVGLAQIGGVIIPFINDGNSVPDFRQIHITMATLIFVCMILTLLLRFIFKRQAKLRMENQVQVDGEVNNVPRVAFFAIS
ncbi:unnamed protein product [Rotaria socialis]|uniref:Major facilitator superfamily (MFS) profile domain-containing protein n=1 Tax=Rotaria socialis TaxID=392032 RepID=A0A817ZNX6_9BILA|nr:unnamed protein product [Rotaria socialis]CAF3387866.1 unnamed protein product [Rotaria socialis]CAF3393689.1 unnamed protein product [Rotaria socialis]CAF4271025.1 unnamed protein product [Rotaria socialis]CAF4531291.1 unnamed protein product [Rotaria socialis]